MKNKIAYLFGVSTLFGALGAGAQTQEKRLNEQGPVINAAFQQKEVLDKMGLQDSTAAILTERKMTVANLQEATGAEMSIIIAYDSSMPAGNAVSQRFNATGGCLVRIPYGHRNGMNDTINAGLPPMAALPLKTLAGANEGFEKINLLHEASHCGGETTELGAEIRALNIYLHQGGDPALARADIDWRVLDSLFGPKAQSNVTVNGVNPANYRAIGLVLYARFVEKKTLSLDDARTANESALAAITAYTTAHPEKFSAADAANMRKAHAIIKAMLSDSSLTLDTDVRHVLQIAESGYDALAGNTDKPFIRTVSLGSGITAAPMPATTRPHIP